MTDEFSVGKEAANFATTFIKNNIKEISGFIHETVDVAKSSVQLRLKSTYTEYLTCIGERYSKVKTFLLNQEAVDLYKFYVPLGVSVQGTDYPDVTISDLTLTNNFNVITGTAGSGKSMMMRYLFLGSIKNREKIPVFFELREFNSIGGTLVDAIKRRLADNKFDLGSEYIDRAFQLGHFVLFLDGFDELAETRRELIATEIAYFAKRFDKNQIVVSSRPDDYFNQWSNFRIWSIENLTLEKACQLIERLPYDEDVKNKFVKDLKEKLFDEHEYFLSNPLLLTIMWLCYGENAEIPKKYSLFYERAYEALFNKHDARKGGFQRTRKTALDIKEFSDVFSAVAIQSFDDERVEFSETEAIHYIDKAKKLTVDKFNSRDFLEDSIKAVCLLLEDGLGLRFSHRSFQEYFTAVFILNSDLDIQIRLLQRQLEGDFTDNVLELAYSMNPGAVETSVIIPEIENLENQIGYKGKITKTVYANYLRIMCSHLEVHPRANPKTLKQEEVVLYRIRDRRLNHIHQLVWHCLELDELTERYLKALENSRAKVVHEVKRLASPNTSVSIEEAIKDKIFFQTHLNSGFPLHLERLLTLKKILIEKHHKRKESLKDVLGI